jgi:hypothetical protein
LLLFFSRRWRVRQKLPETAGSSLLVNDIGRTIAPGMEFDCDLLVPGCVPVDDTPDGGEEDADSPAEPAAGEDTSSEDESAEAATAAPGEPQTEGTRL